MTIRGDMPADWQPDQLTVRANSPRPRGCSVHLSHGDREVSPVDTITLTYANVAPADVAATVAHARATAWAWLNRSAKP